MSWRTWKTGCLAKVKTQEEYNSVLKTVPTTTRPQFVEDFGYKFTDEGELRNAETGEPFAWLGQKHYDALGDAVVPTLQRTMVQDFGLQEKRLPVDADASKEPTCPIFLSPDALTAETLVLLIQGSGAVRPGQWARALCINNNLDVGTIFPYLKKIKDNNWGVVVFNPNENYVMPDPPATTPELLQYWLGTPDDVYKEQQKRMYEEAVPIRDNDGPGEHCVYVWDEFIAKAQAQNIVIIAHSAGGRCTRILIKERGDQLLPKLRGVAFTDAKWKKAAPGKDTFGQIHKILAPMTINWATSDLPLDAKLPTAVEMGPIPQRSAGHEQHEWTSGSCIKSVFQFLEAKLAQ